MARVAGAVVSGQGFKISLMAFLFEVLLDLVLVQVNILVEWLRLDLNSDGLQRYLNTASGSPLEFIRLCTKSFASDRELLFDPMVHSHCSTRSEAESALVPQRYDRFRPYYPIRPKHCVICIYILQFNTTAIFCCGFLKLKEYACGLLLWGTLVYLSD